MTHQEEIWKDFPNYEGYYQVSNLGRVKSLPRSYKAGKSYLTNCFVKGCIMRQHIDKTGYFKIVLKRNNKPKTFNVSRVVGILFVPNPNNEDVVNHIDGVRTNNVHTNLEWVSQRENVLHAYRIGLKKRPNGKLNPRARKVVSLVSGIVYDCAKDAASALNIGEWALYKQLRGVNKNKHNLVYAD